MIPDSLLDKENCLLGRSSFKRCREARLDEFGLEERHKVSADKLFGRLETICALGKCQKTFLG